MNLLYFLVWGTILMVMPLRGEWMHGTCIRITDGDTATVLVQGQEQVRIRFWGIDSPEKGQPFGTQARQKLAELIFGKHVRVDVVEYDRYGRSIGKVHVGNLYANLEMIRCGMAWHYREYAPYDTELSAAECEARSKRIGIWSHAHPVPPWQWRRQAVLFRPESKEAARRSPHETYWISRSGKVHNSSCRYYGRTQRGYFSPEPQGENCRICGGAR